MNIILKIISGFGLKFIKNLCFKGRAYKKYRDFKIPTLKSAACYLGVSPKTLKTRISQGIYVENIHFAKFGKRYRFSKESLDEIKDVNLFK